MKVERDERYTQLSKLDQLIYISEIEKCENCKGYNNCQLNTKGLYPVIHEHERLDKETILKTYYASCPIKKEYFKKQSIQLTGKYSQEIMKSDSSVLDQNQKNIINNLFLNGEGFIYGSAGVGKTTILKLLAKKFYEENKSVHFDLASNITLSLRDFDKLESKMSVYQNAEILFIDDFAREYMTSWNILNVWTPIIQYRIDNNKPTYISCNYNLSELGELISKLFIDSSGKQDFVPAETVVDRISKLKTFKLVGKNYRI